MTQIVIFIGGVVLGVIFGRMWRDFATQGSKEYRTLSGHPASHYAPSSTAATPSAETRAAPVAAARAERAPPPAPAAAPSAAATRDDLKAIKGVGPRLEALLNEMGITA